MTTRLLISNALPYSGPRGGIARYARQLAAAATARHGDQVAICSADRIAPSPARWIPVPRFPGSGRLRVHALVTTAASVALRPRLFFGSYYGSARTAAPEIFTVHDCIHEIFRPGDAAMIHRALREKQRCLERAAAIIAISHNTERDILRFYPSVDPGKIVVIHLGVDAAFFDPPPASVPSRPYFLFVGNRAGHKNFRRLAEAFAAAQLSRDFDLLVVSPFGGLDPGETAHLDALGIASAVRVLSGIDDAKLRAAYAGATALVYPSEYEGFGLPIVEAMASGTLVAASHTASLPEVGGEVADYFDPESIESIAATMTRIAGLDPQARRERVRAGIARAHGFSWERCTSGTLELFEQVINRERLSR